MRQPARADNLIISLHAGGWMIEKTGIRNEIAILDSHGYNLGQNKMRNRSTPPPNSMMHSRYNENAPLFHHWGGVILIFHPFCPRL